MRFNLRNPNTQKWMLGIGVAFALVYGYFNFVYNPRRIQAAQLTADIKKESDMLARGKRIAANYQTVQDDYSRLMDSWTVAQQLLPTQREMEELLKSVAMEGQKHNVDFLLFKPQDPVEKSYYWEYAIQVKTLSNFHDLARFLSSVASLERIVNVNNLRMTAYTATQGKGSNTVEADFTATIYVFKDLTSSTNVAGSGGKNASPPPNQKAEG